MNVGQTLPCPCCRDEKHALGEFQEFPETDANGEFHRWQCPPDVTCKCGATLRPVVPIFKVNDFGWHWKAVIPGSQHGPNPPSPRHDKPIESE